MKPLRTATALTLAALLALSACGDDETKDADDAPTSIEDVDVPAEMDGADVPDECVEPFPFAYGEPDLDGVDLMPADWPEPPVDAILCATQATLDESIQSIDYATTADIDTVLTSYTEVLAAGSPVREPGPLGGTDVLNGMLDDTSFQIEPRDGGFSIHFAE